jgi:PAS domain-containing protein
MEGTTTGKHIVLIVARELAVNIATPLFIVDEAGTLVFFNEAAERLLGRTFRATGDLPANEWMSLFKAETPEGVLLTPEDRPLASVLTRLVPVHRRMVITGADGDKRRLVVTAYPLMPTLDRVVGAIAIFWEDPDQVSPA